jgi:hypothetical protein
MAIHDSHSAGWQEGGGNPSNAGSEFMGGHASGGGEAAAAGAGQAHHTLLDLVEEYALLVVVFVAVGYFLYTKLKKGVDAVAFEMNQRKFEDAMRRAREAQQAKFWEESAQKREELERLEEQRRKEKLEDMEAAAEGRTSKNKKDYTKTDTQDYWDGKDGFSLLNPGGGGSRYKPSGSCSRRRGG